MSGFGRIASFFHAKRPQERRIALNIDLDLDGKGAGKTATVEFMVNRWGKVRLLNEDKLPEEIRKKYGNTILAAVVSVTGWEVVRAEQGLRLRSPNGIVEYEFMISLKDGRSGIPFRIKPFSGKREYGDLRNYIVSSYLEGATISIKINAVNCDLKNSELREITRRVRRFEIYNLDGSQTLVYKSEPQPTLEKALYREYETYRRLFIVKHLLPGKITPIKFSYSAFDAPEGMPWLPSRVAKEIADERGRSEIALQHLGKATDDSFGNGFEVVADVLPETLQVQRVFGKVTPSNWHKSPKGQLPSTQDNAIKMEHSDSEVAGAKQMPLKGMDLSAKRKERNFIISSATNIAKEGSIRQAYAHEKSVKPRPALSQGNSGSSRSGARKSKPVPISALSSFKAVIFDLDGVIVDSEMVHPRTFERALSKYGIKIENAHWKRAYTGIGSYAIFDDIVKKYGIAEDARELVKKRNDIYMEEITRNRLPVIEGFHEVHRLLVESGVREAVASGGHTNHVEESMRSAGLKNMPFVAIEQVKKGKPSPEIFLKAAKRLRVKPSECIVFEDSLSGVEAAARAGMPCVALSTTMSRKELLGKAALIVNDYRSKRLKKLLAVLLEKREDGEKRKGKPAKGRQRKLSRKGR